MGLALVHFQKYWPLSQIFLLCQDFDPPHNKGVCTATRSKILSMQRKVPKSQKIPKKFIKFPSNRPKTLSGLFKSFSSKISNYLCPQNVMYIKELKKKSCNFSKNTNQPIFSQAKSVPYLVFVFTKLHLIFSFYPNTISQQDDLAC